jgi:hypothetical protein
MAPADPILGVGAAYKADPASPDVKVNLGIGAYRDSNVSRARPLAPQPNAHPFHCASSNFCARRINRTFSVTLNFCERIQSRIRRCAPTQQQRLRPG